MGWIQLDASDSEYRNVASFCDHDDELFRSEKWEGFLNFWKIISFSRKNLLLGIRCTLAFQCNTTAIRGSICSRQLQKADFNMCLRARVFKGVMWIQWARNFCIQSVRWHQYIFGFSTEVVTQWHITFSQSISSLREALFSCWTICTMECNLSEFVPSLKDTCSLFWFCLTKLSVTRVSNYCTIVTTKLGSM